MDSQDCLRSLKALSEATGLEADAYCNALAADPKAIQHALRDGVKVKAVAIEGDGFES